MILGFCLEWYSIQDGPFWGCSRLGVGKMAPLHNICHAYFKMVNIGTVMPYLKKIQKIYKSRDFTRNQQILL